MGSIGERDLIVVVFAALVSCVPPHPDDGFRARLAAGCNTEQECAAIEREAVNRYGSCRTNCDDLLAERTEARRLEAEQRKRASAEHDGRVKQQNEYYEAASNERQRLHKAAGRLRGTCDDDAILNDELGRIPSTIALEDREEMTTRFRDLARKRRESELQQRSSDVEWMMRRRVVVDMAGMGDPDAARTPIAEAKQLLADVRCKNGEATLTELSVSVDEWGAATEQSIQVEKACRASPECMGGRAAKPVCEALERRKGWIADIARERRNPAGVVNLSYLNELGRNVQDTDEEIATKKKAYATAAKKPFTEAMCSRK